jgi:hypothetical protein
LGEYDIKELPSSPAGLEKRQEVRQAGIFIEVREEKRRTGVITLLNLCLNGLFGEVAWFYNYFYNSDIFRMNRGMINCLRVNRFGSNYYALLKKI